MNAWRIRQQVCAADCAWGKKSCRPGIASLCFAPGKRTDRRFHRPSRSKTCCNPSNRTSSNIFSLRSVSPSTSFLPAIRAMAMAIYQIAIRKTVQSPIPSLLMPHPSQENRWSFPGKGCFPAATMVAPDACDSFFNSNLYSHRCSSLIPLNHTLIKQLPNVKNRHIIQLCLPLETALSA